jgi:hypothetical protein
LFLWSCISVKFWNSQISNSNQVSKL